MSETTISSDLQKQIWLNDFFKEGIRETGYAPYMSKVGGSKNPGIIFVKQELQEEAGKTINIPLITKLRGNGVAGSQALEGNEEQMSLYNCPVSIDWQRNAVTVPKSTQYKTEINLLNAAKPMLKDWTSERNRDDITMAFLQSITGTNTVQYYGLMTEAATGGYEITVANSGGAVVNLPGIEDPVTTASEANKDAWLAANSDRVLFGAARSNIASNDHSAALANVDSTSDKLTTATASLAKRMARAASPRIKPYKSESGREYFVMFCQSRAFRDLKLDSAMVAANRDARAREVDNNPLFQDGDLIYDGIIFREIPEIPVLAGVGNGSIDVAPNFLCGQGAIGIAWGQIPTPRTAMDRDYQFRPGVGIDMLLGTRKMAFNGKQHGMVTLYTSGAADS